MANDTYMTPGSAVADQLQQILTSRRLEERQNQQDALNAQNVQSQIKARDVASRELEARIAGLNDDRKAQEIERVTKTMAPHSSAPGTLAYLHKNAPWLIDAGQAGTDPLGPGEEGPTQPAIPEQFHGLPAQLETETKDNDRKAAKAIFEDKEKWNSLDKPHQAAVYRILTGSEPGANVIKEDADDVPIVVDGIPNGYWTTKGAIQFHTPKPERPTALDVPTKYDRLEPDPTDPTKTVPVSYWLKPGDQPTEKNKISGLMIKGNAPPAKAPLKEAIVPPGIETSFNKAAAAASANPENKTLQGQLTDWGNSVIEHSSASKAVKVALTTRWTNAGLRGSRPNPPGPGATKDAQDLYLIWTKLNSRTNNAGQ